MVFCESKQPTPPNLGIRRRPCPRRCIVALLRGSERRNVDDLLRDEHDVCWARVDERHALPDFRGVLDSIPSALRFLLDQEYPLGKKAVGFGEHAEIKPWTELVESMPEEIIATRRG